MTTSSQGATDVRLLLDTAVLIFAVEAPERLSKRASVALRKPDNVLELSTISLAEIAIKASAGKLRISEAVLRQAIESLNLRVLAYTREHALQLFNLPRHHGDPFDRQIIAQSLCEQIPVVTSDRQFSLYEGVKVFW